ncbi:hypothetical protein BHM03_00008863 [Ensete ventricosum]|nr:hypothetical protein BHM03_00008863 [Ensete ventricosum]
MQRRRSYPVRDKIMQRYDQELLGAPLCCTTQQEEMLCIQGVNVLVPQRRVFVCASKLALDESLSHQHMGAIYYRGRSPNESLGHQHMGAVYHRGRSQIGSTSGSHGGDLIIQRGGTSVESSIPCSHGGRTLVVKGAKEVENAKANSKYQDRAEG